MKLPFDRNWLDRLTQPGNRLPWIEKWLMDEVWSEVSFSARAGSPSGYLLHGEALVNELESLLAAGARSVFDELADPPSSHFSVASFLNNHVPSAVVILDGCSIREVPRLLSLARASRRPVLECASARAALPSETEYFLSDRLGLGLPVLGPSQIEGRSELRQQKIRAFYYRQPNDHHTIGNPDEHLLLWSRFPDLRYTDSTAADHTMFEAIWDGLEQVWSHTVQAVPPDRTILVTSDHGYLFLGPGLSDPNLEGIGRVLDGKRYRFFGPDETLPGTEGGLWIDQARRLAMLAGRAHNRPHAPSASNSVYRHGGLSLMEMLTPWLVLGPVGRIS